MSAALASAAGGAGLVAASSLATLLVARATARAPGPVAAPALALTYLAKVLLLGWVLLTVPAPGWLRPGWCAAGVLAALAVSLVLAARGAARRSRPAGAGAAAAGGDAP